MVTERAESLTLQLIFLAVFSIVGALRVVPVLVESVAQRGIVAELCDRSTEVETTASFSAELGSGAGSAGRGTTSAERSWRGSSSSRVNRFRLYVSACFTPFS